MHLEENGFYFSSFLLSIELSLKSVMLLPNTELLCNLFHCCADFRKLDNAFNTAEL